MFRVYVDFDDVLCETARAFTGLLERRFGRRVAFEDIHSFNLEESFSLGPDDLTELMRLGHLPEFLLGLEPVDGAVASMEEWAGRGVEVWIVTGRPTSSDSVSREWLQRRGVPYQRLLFVDKYSRRLPGHEGAEPLALEELRLHEFGLAVEDAPPMADYLLRNMRMPVAVLDRPWNRRDALLAVHAEGRLRRCRNWTDVRRHVPPAGR